MNNKDKAVYDWLLQNQELQRLPLFCFLQDELYAAAVVPVPDTAYTVEHLDGSRVGKYTFVLKLQVPLSQTHDQLNLAAMAAMRGWQDWIEQQQRARSYPDFGPRCCGYELVNLANMPQIAATAADGSRAVLSFPAAITYMEEM